MITPAPPGAITSAKASSTYATPSRSTATIRSAVACTGESPAVWARARTGPSDAGGRGQVTDRRRVGDVDPVRDDVMARLAEGRRGGLQRLLVDVGEQDPVLRARGPDDGLAHPADPDHHQHAVVHRPAG